MRFVRRPSRRSRLALVASMVAFSVLALAGGAYGGGRDAAPQRAIVVLEEGASIRAVLADYDIRASHVYRHALRGFAAPLTAATQRALAGDARVAFVEADQKVRLFAQATPTGIDRIFATSNTNIDIDQTDDVRIDVDVAVIDTGIDYDHPDLNVVARTDCSGGGPFSSGCTDGSGDDGNGHGTHVAGTIAAIDNGIGVVGVAPGARLHAVKVLDNSGSGYISWIVAGIDWVTKRAGTIEVANMSLGCECQSDSLDAAIASSVDAGVVHAVAAGNSDADAKTHSPANHPDVITVSALADSNGVVDATHGSFTTCRTDEEDTLANFSNWGATIEVAAPGVCILSTWKGGGYDTISGTSMASPHVAGAAALLASGSGDPKTESDVFAIRSTIVTTGNFDWVDDSGDGTQEPLLDVRNTTVYNPAKVSSGGGGGEEPVTGISLSATGYKIKGVQHADLTWSGATSTDVDVYRNGAKVATTANDGAYTDNIGKKGGGSYTYKVCEAGTTTCSNEATVTF